ncbi:MAG: UDP-N-acetyl-D-galactosamine dehydrogenase [Bacteroidetes bacterium GWA2_31_9]|nr:MAG: UDP-N-acetyl-D-galactosamine dehydrogenase [Bacteroidetes bacterium GWA2_31_9]
MYNELLNKKLKLSVIGLGYVGLPIALEFAKKISVIGFDIKADRVEKMKNKIDPSEELCSSDFDNCDILFTANQEDLRAASFHIVAVPTPIDSHNLPDLKPLLSATKIVAQVLKKGDYVVFESTVYPGCTEDDCLPILESISGLKLGVDFKIGYSPERINPGDKEHTISTITKIVSGNDSEALDSVAKVYELIVKAGVHRASTIKVAESAKIIENTQRDVNIALMNELSIIFNRMGINTYEVLEAAGTKWNFLKFYPGLVGGHCIGVDPYYLTFKAREFRYHSQVINSGRFVNDSMGFYVAKQTVKKIIAAGKNVLNSRVLVMGVTFKENVSDIRNSRVADVISELKTYGVQVDVVDPHASSTDLKHEYGFELTDIKGSYDAVIVAVNHVEYVSLTEDYFESITNKNAIIFDVKGIYKSRIKNMTYMSL